MEQSHEFEIQRSRRQRRERLAQRRQRSAHADRKASSDRHAHPLVAREMKQANHLDQHQRADDRRDDARDRRDHENRSCGQHRSRYLLTQPLENRGRAPAAVHPNNKRSDNHRDTDSDRLVQRLENQLAREAGAKQRREHAQRKAVNLDIVLDRRKSQRPEQQQRENYNSGCVIHEGAKY